MAPDEQQCKRKKRIPRPLDKARLEELALAYVARFATSAAKLERYLARKLRERGWADADQAEGGDGPDIPALVERYVALGYVDDAAFARAKSGSLLRRGFGGRRVNQALGEAGIEEALREEMRPDENGQRRAALVLARKRRFGPFGVGGGAEISLDRPRRDKQIAAMLRAGHSFESARALIDAPTEDAALQWAMEHDDDDSQSSQTFG